MKIMNNGVVGAEPLRCKNWTNTRSYFLSTKGTGYSWYFTPLIFARFTHHMWYR